MRNNYPKFFFDAAQGALLRQDHPDEVTFYYIEFAALAHPPGSARRAWQLPVHAEQGYCIDTLLGDEWKMKIAEENFTKLLNQCQITPVTLNEPLPSWFSWPSRSH